jgi:hypothetical protein
MKSRLLARRILERDGNVVLVRFDGPDEPNPPAPRFPGAIGLRPADGSDTLWEEEAGGRPRLPWMTGAAGCGFRPAVS